MYKVMIVEDELYLLRELTETVPWERFGFRVAGTAESLEVAQTLYAELRPDLLVTDIRLPGGSGLDLLDRCRPRAAIVITGHDQFEYARRALRLGASDFLLKPIDDAELEDALRRVQLRLAGRGGEEREAVGALVSRPADSRERHVLAAEDFIRRRYRDDISLAEAAAELGLSESHLSRIMREQRGRTFVEILTAHRLTIAAELLRDQRLRIGEIAELCGFRDQGYLARTFRRRFGLSPSDYRLQIPDAPLPQE